jgi:hypothetical protein
VGIVVGVRVAAGVGIKVGARSVAVAGEISTVTVDRGRVAVGKVGVQPQIKILISRMAVIQNFGTKVLLWG